MRDVYLVILSNSIYLKYVMLMFRVGIAPEGSSFPKKLKQDFEAEN